MNFKRTIEIAKKFKLIQKLNSAKSFPQCLQRLPKYFPLLMKTKTKFLSILYPRIHASGQMDPDPDADPDPDIFVIDPQDDNKKQIKKRFFANYF